ncbi:hypothetical protein JKA73_27985 [Myxococcus xanthus]|uniref:hypothetical protein n=1 Tax=Myxococcus xanthus TaxID=34 RepID=UPI0019172CA9|nr:hypothetical protein [Myxococcus xanthus]QQR42870.1 hypothetical protein JKA73_27985 [Myxococcus xanthus]
MSDVEANTVQASPEAAKNGLQIEGSSVNLVVAPCKKTYQPAKTFKELVELLKPAEEMLDSAGFTSVLDRIHVLRGIYYGTEWSADYKVEKSPVRNAAFQIYTSSSPPADPRPILRCNLYQSLLGSRDVKDGARMLDFGHLLIGLDARRSSIARNATLPTQGGSGLEISTWLGDLGGGAAMLAKKRVSAKETSALTSFTGFDFGGSPNLEGDIAGYVTACDPKLGSDALGLFIPEDKTLANMVEAYLSPGAPGALWKERCTRFLFMLGGELEKGKFTNRDELIRDVSKQIASFGCWYLTNRLRQTESLTSKLLIDASKHMRGASAEVAQLFIDALIYGHEHPMEKLQARGPAPKPTPAGEAFGVCNAFIKLVEGMEDAGKKGGELQKKLESLQKDLGELYKELRW